MPNGKYPNACAANNSDTKNYCWNNARCVKCTARHLTSECPRKAKDDNVKCVNCHEKHPANYRGCMIHKKSNKNVPKTERTSHRNKTTSIRSNLRSGCTRTNRTASNKCTSTSRNEHGTTSKRPNRTQMVKNLLDQMGTLNLITALLSKNN